jgi:hypothetical protein
MGEFRQWTTVKRVVDVVDVVGTALLYLSGLNTNVIVSGVVFLLDKNVHLELGDIVNAYVVIYYRSLYKEYPEGHFRPWIG